MVGNETDSGPQAGKTGPARPVTRWRGWLALGTYNALTPVLFLALLPGWFGRARARGRWNEDFRQRLGWPRRELRAWCELRKPVWVHAVSVGECGVALRLLGRWLDEAETENFVVTTTTATGRALVQSQLERWPLEWRERVRLAWAPFDLLPCAWLGVKALQPRRLVLTEGEWWPNWLACLGARRVRVDLYNARMSPRSARRVAKFRWLVEPVFARLGWVGLQRQEDAAGFRAVGVAGERLEVTGSVKLDRAGAAGPEMVRVEEFRALLEAGLGCQGEVLMGVSTFAGEEKLILRVVRDLAETGLRLRPVLVPRHAERAALLRRELVEEGWRVLRRSEFRNWADGSLVDLDSTVLLVDTTGELRAWLELADVAVIGKSLPGVARGGQNPAEPLEAGAAVICGRAMDNFRGLVSELVDAQAIAVLQAESVEAAEEELRTLIPQALEPERRREAVQRGQACLARHDGATARTVESLRQLAGL